MKHSFALLFLLVLPVGTVKSQVFSYTEGEVPSAAMMALHSKAPIVDRAMSYCAEEKAVDRARATRTIDAWKERNSAYMNLAPVLLDEMNQISVREKKEKEWQIFRTSTMPKQIELASLILVDQLKALPNIEQKQSMCMNLANAIDAGRLDHANEDPVIQKYLEMRLLDVPTSK